MVRSAAAAGRRSADQITLRLADIAASRRFFETDLDPRASEGARTCLWASGSFSIPGTARSAVQTRTSSGEHGGEGAWCVSSVEVASAGLDVGRRSIEHPLRSGDRSPSASSAFNCSRLLRNQKPLHQVEGAQTSPAQSEKTKTIPTGTKDQHQWSKSLKPVPTATGLSDPSDPGPPLSRLVTVTVPGNDPFRTHLTSRQPSGQGSSPGSPFSPSSTLLSSFDPIQIQVQLVMPQAWRRRRRRASRRAARPLLTPALLFRLSS